MNRTAKVGLVGALVLLAILAGSSESEGGAPSGGAPPGGQPSGAADRFCMTVTGTGIRYGWRAALERGEPSAMTTDHRVACSAADAATRGRVREVLLFPSDGAQYVVDDLKRCLRSHGMTVTEKG